MHTSYAARSVPPRLSIFRADMVPSESVQAGRGSLRRLLDANPGRTVPACTLHDGSTLRYEMSDSTRTLLHLIDGNRTIGDILQSQTTRDGMPRDFLPWLEALASTGQVFLRHRSAEPYPTFAELHQATLARVQGQTVAASTASVSR